MPDEIHSSEQIVSAALALVALGALACQTTDAGRRLEPAATTGLAVVCTANTAESTASIAGSRSRYLLLWYSQETAETVADDDTLASFAAETALSPLRA